MPRKTKNWITAYLEYSENTEPPESFREWTAISMIAAALQRKCWIQIREKPTYPNMYIVLVAPPGLVRKSTAIEDGEMILESACIERGPHSLTKEALRQSLMESASTFTEIDREGNAILHTHSSVTFWADEITNLFRYDDRQFINDMTTLYGCPNEFKSKTMLRGGETIQGVFVNILGATTPQTLKNALPYELIGGGLASRLMFVYEEKKGKTIPIPLPAAPEKRDDLVHDLRQINGMQGKFKITSSFVEAYSKWYIEMDRNPPFKDNTHFANYVGRRPTHLWKLCMILSAATREDMIVDVGVFKLALNTLERVEKNMGFTFSGLGTSKNRQAMQAIIDMVMRDKQVTTSEILRRHWTDIESVGKLQEILGTLSRMGFCTLSAIPPKDGGSKGDVLLTLNPDYIASHANTSQPMEVEG